MILVFEQDTRDHGRGRFAWRPELFRARFMRGRTWRIGWGLWSLSYFPAPGLRDYTEYIEAGETAWFPASPVDPAPDSR